MGKRTYKCLKCNKSLQVIFNVPFNNICECGTEMKIQMPIISGQEVRETVDKHTGVQWKQDQKEMVVERKATYFWEVEVPRMVNSGTYTLETMLENGWVYYDERGKLQTRNRPPQKQ